MNTDHNNQLNHTQPAGATHLGRYSGVGSAAFFQRGRKMATYHQKQLVESYYDFVGFADATGLKAPVVGPAYDNFREFTFALMKQENSFGFDGIITEAFDRWERAQDIYSMA